MPFQAATLFPGDLFEAATRFAADALAEGEASRTKAWQQAREMGWPALLVDEARGGPGGSLADLGAVVEGVARHGLPLPLVRRCAWAPGVLMALGDAGAGVLAALAAGEMDIDPVPAASVSVQGLPDGGVLLRGPLGPLDDDFPATHRLLVADGLVALVPASALPAPAARHRGIDGRRSADLVLDGLTLAPQAVLARGPGARAAARAGADLATLAVSIEIAATLGSSIERSIDYLSQRVQFGTALSGFQVLRHQTVELFVGFECACALLGRLVHDSMAQGEIPSRDARLAKLYLNPLARRSAEAVIQLHGGMGMTTELPTTRLACRLIAASFEFGTPQELLAQLEPLSAALLPPASDAPAPQWLETAPA